MKRLAFFLGILLVSIVVLLENSDKHERNYVPNGGYDDDVWFG